MKTETMVAEMAKQTYGCEIEFTGLARRTMAKVIANALGGTYKYVGGHLNNWVVTAPNGKKWEVVNDSSVSGSYANDGGEMVTPVLTMADMDDLQKVVRAMRQAGAKTDDSCGLHIHVGAKDMTPKQVQNLVKLFYTNEELIVKMADTSEARLRGSYTHMVDRTFVSKIACMTNPTMQKLGEAYYGGYIPANTHGNHYHLARYRTLNLHNIWNGNKHTVEFRFFNFHGKLHAGELRAYVCLAMSLVAMAKMAKKVSCKNRRQFTNEFGKRDAYMFLVHLGMKGAEFKNVREHLMKFCPGTVAYRPRTAA